jgi:hypothetical protein
MLYMEPLINPPYRHRPVSNGNAPDQGFLNGGWSLSNEDANRTIEVQKRQLEELKMKRKTLLFVTLMVASMMVSAAPQGGGMMNMQERVQKMDRMMEQARKTDDSDQHRELMQQHMKEMRETMSQMHEMMGGRQQMMQQMGGGMMGKDGKGGMMGKSGEGAGMGMSPEMMQKRMDMMQMMMDQMMEHQRERDRMRRR